jgi:hypothetical protein
LWKECKNKLKVEGESGIKKIGMFVLHKS